MKKLLVHSIFICLFLLILTRSIMASNSPTPLGLDGNWEYLPQVSDDFDGDSLNNDKWESNNQSWHTSWSWDSSNVNVAQGNLQLTMNYEPHTKFNNSIWGWKERTSRWGLPWGYTTTSTPKTGTRHLRHQTQDCYGFQDMNTYQDLYLSNGTYTFEGYARSNSGHDYAHIKITGHGEEPIILPIQPSDTYTLYSTSIPITTGKITISIENACYGGVPWLDVDDLSLIKEGETFNHIVNPSFEENPKSVPYKSASVVSKERVSGHIYYEARIKAASRHPGVCPAFWATHYSESDHREIDFVELEQSGLKKMDYVIHAAYSKTLSPPITNWTTPGHANYTANFDPRDDFHVYGCEVTEDYLHFYVDGVKVRSINGGHWDYIGKDYNIWMSAGVRPPLHNSPTGSDFPTTIEVDYIRAWKKTTSPPPVATEGVVDDFDSSLTYHGSWNQHNDNSLWFKNTIHATNQINASMDLTFVGNKITLLGRKSSWSGIMNIYLDDVLVSQIDTYSTETLDQEVLFVSDDLDEGQHTFKVSCPGEKNPNSTDFYTHVDKIIIGHPPTDLDDFNESITYTGPWNAHDNEPLWYEGTIHASNTPDAKAELDFNGSGISLYGRKGNWCGIMKVYINNILVETVDTYSSVTQERALLYEVSGLSPGDHHISFVSTGEKNFLSQDSYIHVDQISIIAE